MSRPSGRSWANSVPESPLKNSVGGYWKGKGGFYNHYDSSGLADESAFTPNVKKDNPYFTAPQLERAICQDGTRDNIC